MALAGRLERLPPQSRAPQRDMSDQPAGCPTQGSRNQRSRARRQAERLGRFVPCGYRTPSASAVRGPTLRPRRRALSELVAETDVSHAPRLKRAERPQPSSSPHAPLGSQREDKPGGQRYQIRVGVGGAGAWRPFRCGLEGAPLGERQRCSGSMCRSGPGLSSRSRDDIPARGTVVVAGYARCSQAASRGEHQRGCFRATSAVKSSASMIVTRRTLRRRHIGEHEVVALHCPTRRPWRHLSTAIAPTTSRSVVTRRGPAPTPYYRAVGRRAPRSAPVAPRGSGRSRRGGPQRQTRPEARTQAQRPVLAVAWGPEITPHYLWKLWVTRVYKRQALRA